MANRAPANPNFANDSPRRSEAGWGSSRTFACRLRASRHAANGSPGSPFRSQRHVREHQRLDTVAFQRFDCELSV